MKYSFIPALSTFAIFLVGMRNGTSVNAIECLDTEALVRVSYVPALDHKHYDSSIGTSVQIRPSTSADESFSMNFTDVQNVNDVEVCVTKENACVQIGVAGPAPTSAFTATWDGDEIDLGSELGANFKYDDNKELDYFKAFASTEYGEGCKLPCNEDEAQFEYHYRATDDAFDTHTKQYLVEDGNGEIIIERPMFFGNPSKYLLFTEKKCLPKNDCYRFIAGSYFQPFNSNERTFASFDDDVVFDRTALRFDNVEFGDACPTTKSCDPSVESSVEFYLETIHTSSSDPNITPLYWNLTDISSKGRSTLYHNEQKLTNNLNYDRICVPKETCAAFTLYDPEYNDANYGFRHMLVMDGVIHRYVNELSMSEPDRNPIVTYLGDCTAQNSMICDIAKNESLFELNFQTATESSEYIWKEVGFPRSETRSWYVSETSELESAEIDGSYRGPLPERIIRSNDFIQEYELNTSYKAYKCIPNDKCRYSMFVDKTADIDSYSTKLNGVLSSSKPYKHGPKKIDLYSRYSLNTYEVTPIGNKCKNPLASSLSGGAIAGITVASIVAVGVLVATIFVMNKRTKYAKNEENKDES